MRSVAGHQQRVNETAHDVHDLAAALRTNRYQFGRDNRLLLDAALAAVVFPPRVRPALAVHRHGVVGARGDFCDFGVLLLEHRNRRRRVILPSVAQSEFTLDVEPAAEDYAVAIEEQRVTLTHRDLSDPCAAQCVNDAPS